MSVNPLARLIAQLPGLALLSQLGDQGVDPKGIGLAVGDEVLLHGGKRRTLVSLQVVDGWPGPGPAPTISHKRSSYPQFLVLKKEGTLEKLAQGHNWHGNAEIVGVLKQSNFPRHPLAGTPAPPAPEAPPAPITPEDL